MSVFDEITKERERQNKKWGEQNHTPEKYFVIIGEKYGEAAKEVCEATFALNEQHRIASLQRARKELVETAACCVAMIESLDRNELQPKPVPAYVPDEDDCICPNMHCICDDKY